MIHQNKKNKAQQGFTLIELLVVIAIIGLLASTIISALSSARKNARDATRVSNLRVLRDALDIYYQDNGAYPVAGAWQGTACGKNYITGLTPNYVKQLPADPACGTSICAGTTGKDFIYASNGTAYKLLIDGCFETTKYTTTGGPFADPLRAGLTQWGGVFNQAGSLLY